jgi:hypothetical protein
MPYGTASVPAAVHRLSGTPRVDRCPLGEPGRIELLYPRDCSRPSSRHNGRSGCWRSASYERSRGASEIPATGACFGGDRLSKIGGRHRAPRCRARRNASACRVKRWRLLRRAQAPAVAFRSAAEPAGGANPVPAEIAGGPHPLPTSRPIRSRVGVHDYFRAGGVSP